MQLKRWSLGMGAIALIAAFPFINTPPVSAGLEEIKEAIVNTITRPKIKLNLTVAKQSIQKLKNGRKALVWHKLSGKNMVIPGDILRYTVVGENEGKAEAKNLIITQPIDPQTIYQISSAQSSMDAEISYSINNGKSFERNPTIKVKLTDGKIVEKPAPAENYTHVRWTFKESIPPHKRVKASYLAKVR